MYFNNSASKLRIVLHFADIVCKKQHLRIADVGNKRKAFTVIIYNKTAINNIFFFDIAPFYQIRFPWRSKRRIWNHKVKGLSCKTVVRDGWAEENIIRLCAFAFNKQIALCNSISFVCVFLPVKVNRNLLAVFLSHLFNSLVCYGEHSARAACSVIYTVGWILNFIFNRYKCKVCHKLHYITGSKVASCIRYVCFFIKFSDNFFKHRTHSMIVKRRKCYSLCVCNRSGGKVYILWRKLID